MALVRPLRGGLTKLPAGERRQAWKRLIEIVDQDKWTRPGPRPSPEEEERWIADALAEDEPDRHG